MKLLMYNLFLAIAWTLLNSTFTPANLAEGFVLGYGVLWLTQPLLGRSNYFRKVGQVTSFLLFFVRELVVASFRVAYDVITPRYNARPGVIAVPLDIQSDAEITLLSNLITLTPGTLTLDISDDKRVLYVHAMYVTDVDEFRREIKDGFERRVRELLQ